MPPEAFLEGLLLLQKALGTEQRPLSWVVRAQETVWVPAASHARTDASVASESDRIEGGRRRMITAATIAREISDRFGPAFQDTHDRILIKDLFGNACSSSAPVLAPSSLLQDLAADNSPLLRSNASYLRA
jgi:hypothetical protein